MSEPRIMGCLGGAIFAIAFCALLWFAALSLIAAVAKAEPFYTLFAIAFALMAYFLARHVMREGVA